MSQIFALIQTLNSNDQFLEIQPDYFYCIVIDETHHNAARTAGIAIIPSILIYILLQRYLIEGISLMGMGGR